jgi:hypothetical protein
MPIKVAREMLAGGATFATITDVVSALVVMTYYMVKGFWEFSCCHVV